MIIRSVATEPLNTCFTYSKETTLSEIPIPTITETFDPLMKNDSVIRCQMDNTYYLNFDIKNGKKPYSLNYKINNIVFNQVINDNVKIKFFMVLL